MRSVGGGCPSVGAVWRDGAAALLKGPEVAGAAGGEKHGGLVPALVRFDAVEQLVGASDGVGGGEGRELAAGQDIDADLETAEDDGSGPCGDGVLGGIGVIVEVGLASLGESAAHADPEADLLLCERRAREGRVGVGGALEERADVAQLPDGDQHDGAIGLCGEDLPI